MTIQYAFLNDSIVPYEKAVFHYTDLSIQRGIGIFDFIAVHDYETLFLDDHLSRFSASAREMHLTLSYSNDELTMIINELIRKNEIPDCGIRLTLTGGYSPDGYHIVKPNLLISTHLFTYPTQDQFNRGIRMITHDHQRQMPYVKSIDYMMAVWLQPRLKELGADDVLYYSNDVITECPRANIFMVTSDDQLVTPANNILKGVIRNYILELGPRHYAVEERDITLADLKQAKEVFITSTTKRILPVSQIDNTSYKVEGPVARQLSHDLSELIQTTVAR